MTTQYLDVGRLKMDDSHGAADQSAPVRSSKRPRPVTVTSPRAAMQRAWATSWTRASGPVVVATVAMVTSEPTKRCSIFGLENRVSRRENDFNYPCIMSGGFKKQKLNQPHLVIWLCSQFGRFTPVYYCFIMT